MFFPAKMINYQMIEDATAHMRGGPAALTLGPHAVMISMTIILVIQALFFGDGGITTPDADVWTMFLKGFFISYAALAAASKIRERGSGTP